MKNLRLFACGIAALGALAFAGCSSSTGSSDGSLRVQNNSDFSIVELHVAPVGTVTWGPNLLSGDVLAPGEALTVSVTCDTYDALLVDESGVDCQLTSVDLCFNNAAWVIENSTCTVFSAAAKARAAAAAAAAAGSNGSAATAGSNL